MPQLPKGNSLDYNPDSVFNASKKIRTIQLERMKNPVEDPDQAVLSALQAKKELDQTFLQLEGLAGAYNDLVLRITKYLGVVSKKTEKIIEKGFSSKKKSRKSRIEGEEADGETFADRFNQDQPSNRFTPFYRDDDRNSSAYPSQRGDEPDFLGKFELPSGRSNQEARDYLTELNQRRENEMLRASLSDDLAVYDETIRQAEDILGRGRGGARGEKRMKKLEKVYSASRKKASELLEERGLGQGQDTFITLILSLIKITRSIDILINSRVRPAIKFLSNEMYKNLVALRKLINDSWDKIRRPFLSKIGMDVFENALRADNGEYEDSILSSWNREREKLVLDLTVIINNRVVNISEPAGAQAPSAPVGAGRFPVRLVGSGRNFYGELINETQDIPTIRMSYRDCPTKYLL